MSFRGLAHGFGTPYCNKCDRTHNLKTKAKLSRSVKKLWDEGIYSREDIARRSKAMFARMTPDEKSNFLRPFLDSGTGLFSQRGWTHGYFYRSGYEKQFIESYAECDDYRIIKTDHGIRYWFNGEWRTYLLDFVLQDRKGQIVFVEVKGLHAQYQKEIESGKALAKYGAAKRICEENDMDFWFLTNQSSKLYGCGNCPACEVRARGWEKFQQIRGGI